MPRVRPEEGQALKVKLEGCAEAAPGGPAPLTQIHLQDITPLSGGGAKVDLTSQPFEIPICGRGGASGSTVTTYEPVNLCMAKGDYIDFNDEGGYVANVYPSGVPYRVLGAVTGLEARLLHQGRRDQQRSHDVEQRTLDRWKGSPRPRTRN